MAGRLIGAWNPALDSNGAPLSGAKLHTYAAGTTTPMVTYTDATLVTPLANPVVADSAGRFVEIWAADGSVYDLQWATSGDVNLKLFEDIQSLGATATGAITRDFGADGRVNIEARGGTVYIEAGDASPDNLGGTMHLGGWNGSQLDSLTLDTKQLHLTGQVAGFAPRNYIAGLTLSTAGSAAAFSVAAGTAVDSTQSAIISLGGSGLAKNVGAWVAGNAAGSLDTGAIGNHWYHVYLIEDPDNGNADILISLQATTPALPAGYTLYRRIGSMKNTGGVWDLFYQNGDDFIWPAAVSQVSSSTTSASAFLVTCANIPTGIKVDAKLVLGLSVATGNNNWGTLSSPDTGGLASSNLNACCVVNGATSAGQGKDVVRTNISAQVYLAVTAPGAVTTNYVVGALGWIDRRGKDA